MAQMPRGEPRSVPDPAGEQYDEMIRQEKLRRLRAEEGLTRPPPFSPFDRGVAALFAEPSKRPAPVFRNGREVSVVQPARPPVSPTDLAEQQRGIQRARFLAQSPLGGLAYGIATLAGGSPQTRDRALMAGGLADAVMLGGAPRGPRARGQPTPPKPQLPPAPLRRDDKRLKELNGSGQAMGVEATLTAPMLGSGTRANWRLTPPGWQGNGDIYNEARGHLLGRQLGGLGNDPRNLVTLTQRGANSPQMRDFENQVASRVRSGEVVEYAAMPLYNNGALPPSAILLTAHGSRGAPVARIVNNPAGRPR